MLIQHDLKSLADRQGILHLYKHFNKHDLITEKLSMLY